MRIEDMGLNEGQRAAVEHLSGPLLVSAGAGSGKTFTLVKRLVYALSPESRPCTGCDIEPLGDVERPWDDGSSVDGYPEEVTRGGAARDVGRILVITFTEKAAAELATRMRMALWAEGFDVAARELDSAWISTIHGMCRRIISLDALEVGINPFAQIMPDRDESLLRETALSQCMEEMAVEGRLDRHLAVFNRADQLVPMVSCLANHVRTMAKGEESLLLPPRPRSLREIYAQGLHGMREGLSMIPRGKLGKLGETAEHTVEVLEREGLPIFAEAESEEVLYRRLMALVSRKDLGLSVPGRAASREGLNHASEARAEMVAHLGCRGMRPVLDELLELTKLSMERYDQMKRQRGAIDLNDLLRQAYLILQDDRVARRYQERFDVVMVDEFQDTNQLSLSIIERMVGERASTLCTVGDEQQSIYHFNGADIEVYRAHRRKMNGLPGSAEVKLHDNFRSAPEILAAVRRIFSQADAFGDSFLDLTARRRPLLRPVVAPGEPRIHLLHVSGNEKTKVDRRRRILADALARRFKELADTGVPQGDMVVLVRATSHVERYAQALRAQGLQCSASAGSRFYQTPEVVVLIQYLCALENPHDSSMLVPALVSPIFRLNDDDLLEIACERETCIRERGAGGYPSTYDALSSLASKRDAGGGAGDAQGAGEDRIVRAARQLERALLSARCTTVANLITQAVEGCGWDLTLLSQGIEGKTVFANIIKLTDIATKVERVRGRNLDAISNDLRYRWEQGVHESPGVLAGDGVDAVRIVTIHASKGLEYPIVAVEGLLDDESAHDAGSLLLSTDGDSLRVGMMPRYWGESADARRCESMCDKHFGIQAARIAEGDDGFAHDDPTGYLAKLKERERRAQREEELRLFYVACTRARDVLFLLSQGNATKDGPRLRFDIRDRRGLVGRAFFAQPSEGDGTGAYPGTSEVVDAGGLAVDYEYLQADPLDGEEGAASRDGGETPPSAARFEGGASTADPLQGVPDPSIPNIPQAVGRKPREWTSYSGLSEFAQRAEDDVRGGVDDDGVGGASVDVERATEGSCAQAVERERREALARGTAFHLIMQLVAESPTWSLPSEGLLTRVAQRFGLDVAQRRRVEDAVAHALASDAMRRARRSSAAVAEMPFGFFVGVDGERGGDAAGGVFPPGFYLEGSIDLYCPEGDGHVLIVDYKTGGSPDETPGELHEKHGLQARCYALAAMRGGATVVDLAFVRTEVVDGKGLVQEVRFSYTVEQRADIESELVALRAVQLAG